MFTLKLLIRGAFFIHFFLKLSMTYKPNYHNLQIIALKVNNSNLLVRKYKDYLWQNLKYAKGDSMQFFKIILMTLIVTFTIEAKTFKDVGDVSFTKDQIEFLKEIEEFTKFTSTMKNFIAGTVFVDIFINIASMEPTSIYFVSQTDFRDLFDAYNNYGIIVNVKIRDMIILYIVENDDKMNVAQRKFFQGLADMYDSLF